MPKVYRKKTDLEIALKRYETETGHKPNCHDLAALFEGSFSNMWGLILQRKCTPHREYFEMIKFLKEYGIYAGRLWAYAKKSRKYGQPTRKDGIAPHIKYIDRDLQNFYENQLLENRTRNIDFDDPRDVQEYYLEQVEILRNGPVRPESYAEERKLEEDFYNSL